MESWLVEVNLGGELSNEDVDLMWTDFDVDGSGEVDSFEFTTFLSGCREVFYEVYDEIKQIRKKEKMI